MRTTIARSIAVMTTCMLVFAATAKTTTTEEVLERRVESLHSIVEMRYTREVEHYIHQYTHRHPSTSEKLLGQASVYFPIIENIIRDNDMPDELKYLAVIESGLRPAARSRVGATGMWQFMRSTGRMYGLTINSTVDERKDVIKSTKAALTYLKDLNERFGDWTVALAAYNCGPGNVRRAMRKAGGAKDYWSIQKYLPKETRRYVPKFIAMQYLMSYYHMHDILPQLPEQELRYLAATKVYDQTSFKQLSQQLNLKQSLIKSLNPSYTRAYIPASKDGRYTLTLPEDALFDYLSSVRSASFEDIIYRRNIAEEAPVVVKEERDLMSIAEIAMKRPSIQVDRRKVNVEQILESDNKHTASGPTAGNRQVSYVERFRKWSNKNKS